MGRGTLRRTPAVNVMGGIKSCGKSTSKLLLKKVTKVLNHKHKCSKHLRRFCCPSVLPGASGLRVPSPIPKGIGRHPSPGLPRRMLGEQPPSVLFHLREHSAAYGSPSGYPRAAETSPGEVPQQDAAKAISQAYGSPSGYPSTLGKSGSLGCPSGQSTDPSASLLRLGGYPGEDEGFPELGSPQERLPGFSSENPHSGRGGAGSGITGTVGQASGAPAPAGSGAFLQTGNSAQNPGVPQLSSGSSGPHSQAFDHGSVPRHSVAATFTTTTTMSSVSTMSPDGGAFLGGPGFSQPDLAQTLLQMLFAGRPDLFPATAPAAAGGPTPPAQPQRFGNTADARGNYTVISTAGSIPATGQVPHTSGAQAGHARSASARYPTPASGALQHPHQQHTGVTGPPSVQRVPQAHHSAGKPSTVVGGLNRLPTPGLSDVTSSGPSMSLLTKQSFGETHSPGSGAGLSSYSEEDMEVEEAAELRAFSREKVSAQSIKLQADTAAIHHSMEVAYKYIPSNVLPPIQTPAPAKRFTLCEETPKQPKKASFLQFPPSTNFAHAFSHKENLLAQKAHPKLVQQGGQKGRFFHRHLTKYPECRDVNLSRYAPLSRLWADQTTCQSDVDSLLVLPPGVQNTNSVKFPVPMEVLTSMERQTRAPLDLLSYWDWFGEAAKIVYSQIVSLTDKLVLQESSGRY